MTVEFHLIQNYPPSNPNRDETGSPKDCEFGGHRRARISSQSLKRTARKSPLFEQHVKGKIADRSRRVATEIAQRLHAKDERFAISIMQEAATILLRLVLKSSKAVSDEHIMSYAYYISPAEMNTLMGYVEAHAEALPGMIERLRDAETELTRLKDVNKKAGKAGKDEAAEKAASEHVQQAQAALEELFKNEAKSFRREQETFARTMDIALFGRMLADATDLNIDAASQVAHAISTNRLKAGFDFYTWVDDFQPDTEPGAGMMGTIGFNASCYYRYALIDMDQLALNLTPPPEKKGEEKKPSRSAKEAACDGLEAFLRASIFAVPTGKKHSFAHQVQPQFIMAVARNGKGSPCSLVNAFVKPARPRSGPDLEVSLVEDSIAKLARHWKSHLKMFGKHHAGAYVVTGEELDIATALDVHGEDQDFPGKYDLEEKDSVDALVEAIRSDLTPWLKDTTDA